MSTQAAEAGVAAGRDAKQAGREAAAGRDAKPPSPRPAGSARQLPQQAAEGGGGAIRVVLHIYATPATLPIVDELFLALHASRLYFACERVHCFVAGPDRAAMKPVLAYLVRRAGKKAVIARSAPGDTSHERLALENLHTLVSPRDVLLYMHTKGASAKYLPGGAEHATKGENVAAWRRALILECVQKWQSCVEALRADRCDVVGPGFRPAPVPHFSGNFWWARGDYLLARTPRRLGPDYFAPELAFLFPGRPRVGYLSSLPLGDYDKHQPVSEGNPPAAPAPASARPAGVVQPASARPAGVGPSPAPAEKAGAPEAQPRPEFGLAAEASPKGEPKAANEARGPPGEIG